MRKLILATVPLLLAACATGTIDRTNVAGTLEELSPNEARMAVINHRAKLAGVEIHWVNPPQVEQRTVPAEEEDEEK